jgi:hypothetical protein
MGFCHGSIGVESELVSLLEGVMGINHGSIGGKNESMGFSNLG